MTVLMDFNIEIVRDFGFTYISYNNNSIFKQTIIEQLLLFSFLIFLKP